MDNINVGQLVMGKRVSAIQPRSYGFLILSNIRYSMSHSALAKTLKASLAYGKEMEQGLEGTDNVDTLSVCPCTTIQPSRDG